MPNTAQKYEKLRSGWYPPLDHVGKLPCHAAKSLMAESLGKIHATLFSFLFVTSAQVKLRIITKNTAVS